ncbi:MAG: cobalt-zinc-cadmium efflux system membrane fusion protein [Limisphaerales bacterium]|jgi:cobalt-zinc-cadmium efflux system membrane fusion protein
MNHLVKILSPILLVLAGCDLGINHSGQDAGLEPADEHTDQHEEAEQGPNGGRILRHGDITLELAIFEIGVDPEYRAWITKNSEQVDASRVDLHVILHRLGGVTDDIEFSPQGDFLRGDTVVYEPHSFDVSINARINGESHEWEYENHEGRVAIPSTMAVKTGIETEIVGPAVILDSATVYGRAIANPEKVSHVMARFDGVVVSVSASIGSQVTRGQKLAVVEADDSLTSYTITAPIAGTIVERHANPGEATGTRTLFTIIDSSSLWAELAVFPSDRSRVSVGDPVAIRTAVGDLRFEGQIAVLSPIAGRNQSVTALVPLDNTSGGLAVGMYLTGEIAVGAYEVPLAVKRSGLQAFRDFTVVYAKYDDTYEVRMLELGRQDETWVEVLGGITPGTPYVSTNSYIIKADIEKSGASHDH